ncbi:NAD(P)-dependent oxidoreductase [Pseudomonas sp. CCC3.1]|uniref:NAD(P)-dependent oxidoreductase n=1 Tax=Pseudomonas sp. CCC3.1 TaxID=3048607 RepID=UPI002AC8B83A|nr:NAD(P)-dependent oxidoreductase [Pseudomonas sp. CCC3.1]MEB0207516.1 NAD(P)-dependent oxidoreductase [Pseudomonas sp. CCC3.1]WPX36755.1 NAD(P)-dependent oxidoreductase [Pseudomonas sp. CCC3.1]
MKTVLVTGDFDIPEGALPPDIKLIHLRTLVNEHSIREALPFVQGYIVGGPEYVSSELLSMATELKHLVVMGTGTASFVDIEAATQRGIRVSNTPGLNVQAVVEFTLAMMTVCTAGVFESIECVKDGSRWPQTVRPSIADQSIGIIGMGNIGQALAKEFHIKGCRQLYYWSRQRKYAAELELGLNYTSIKDMVKTVKYLFIHIAGCDETYRLIDADVLDKSKSDLSIFNMSSPKIICSVALRKYLINNPEAFCFIDGYYNEWISNAGVLGDPYKLLELPFGSLVATSHLSALRKDALKNILISAIATLNVCFDAGSESKRL